MTPTCSIMDVRERAKVSLHGKELITTECGLVIDVLVSFHMMLDRSRVVRVVAF